MLHSRFFFWRPTLLKSTRLAPFPRKYYIQVYYFCKGEPTIVSTRTQLYIIHSERTMYIVRILPTASVSYTTRHILHSRHNRIPNRSVETELKNWLYTRLRKKIITNIYICVQLFSSPNGRDDGFPPRIRFRYTSTLAPEFFPPLAYTSGTWYRKRYPKRWLTLFHYYD